MLSQAAAEPPRGTAGALCRRVARAVGVGAPLPTAIRREWPLVALLVALTAVRLAFAAAIPMTEDESYYAVWAQHLAAGYYDHPPMIAWWIAAGEAVAGDSCVGVRLLPILSCTAGAALAADIAGRFGVDAAGRRRVVIWINSAPLIGIGGLLAVPDAPTLLAWMLALWSMAAIVQQAPRRGWLLLGAAVGLGMLSKYSTGFLALGLLGWSVWEPRARSWLRTPWPLAAALLAMLLFAPNALWNAAHGWVTVRKQVGRIGLSTPHLANLAGFAALQMLLFNPFTAALLVQQIHQRKADPRLERAVFAAVAPFLGYLTLHAAHATVQAHWPAPTYLPLTLLAAVSAPPRRGEAWIPLGLGVSGLALALLAAPLPGAPDLAGSLRGWPEFARAVDHARLKHEAAWVGTLSYGLEAQLMRTGAIKAPIAQLDEPRRYAAWSAPGLPTGVGLVVDLPRRATSADLQTCFGRVQPLEPLDRGDPGGPATPYAVWIVQTPRPGAAARGCTLPKDRRGGVIPASIVDGEISDNGGSFQRNHQNTGAGQHQDSEHHHESPRPG